MPDTTPYVREDEYGVKRVGQSRVMLDSVLAAFQQGHSAETIAQQYPALWLEQVFGAIAYYLGNKEAVDQYLQRQDGLWKKEREKADRAANPVVNRMRNQAAKTESDTPMSRPRFLADHDLNEHIVARVLRQEPAIEFPRVRDVGMSERTDDEILEYAKRESLIVVSHDVNTMPATAYARVSAGDSFPGLFMGSAVVAQKLVIDSLILTWSASELEEWENSVVFLPFD